MFVTPQLLRRGVKAGVGALQKGYQGYQGYGAEAPKVQSVAEILSEPLGEMTPDLAGTSNTASRQRRIADMLTQGFQQQDNTSLAGGLSQLGQAFLARGANKKADKAETERDQIVQALTQKAAAGDEASIAMLLSPEAAIGRSDTIKRQGVEDARYVDERDYGRGRDAKADDLNERMWLRDEQRYETEKEFRERTFDRGIVESDRSYDLQSELGRGGLAMERERLDLAKEEAANKGPAGTRYLTPEELKAAGYPEGAVVQVDAKGEDSVRFKPSAEFSAGEIKGFRDKSNVLSEFDRTLNEYKTLVSTSGLKKLHKPDDVDAARLDALKQSLTFQAKDLLNLGILSKDDYENLDRLIPDATGVGAMWKNKDSFNASLGPLEATITSQLGMIPEQYRSGNATAMGGTTRTPSATSTGPSGGGEMPYVDNPASYEAVPPGGYYVGPDGQTRQKPHYLPIGGR